MLGVPTMLVAMLEHPSFASTDLSSVKAICSGGSTVPAALVTRLEKELGAPLYDRVRADRMLAGGGHDENVDTIEDKAGTIGLPLPNMENKIINPDTGKTVPVGEIGEFCTRGYHVMLGYFEMPTPRRQSIDADGWLHTGDLCAMDARGYCTVEGRLKDMIIRGGENIYPRELEELAVSPSHDQRDRGHRPAAREMGRGSRRLHPPGARRRHRQGGTVGLHARLARSAQDAENTGSW
jgi:fatty-acyl-CoA synthase